jgi:hypothetical protein
VHRIKDLIQIDPVVRHSRNEKLMNWPIDPPTEAIIMLSSNSKYSSWTITVVVGMYIYTLNIA